MTFTAGNMEKEDINIMRMLVDTVLFHARDEYPGWRAQFILTFTDDERLALERIRKELAK
jgi:hypothetical protein